MAACAWPSWGEAFGHHRVKPAVTLTLGELVRAKKLGILFVDGMLLTNDDAEIGCEPDTTGAIATEVVGSPDLVMEAISPSSVAKDTEWSMARYHEAGMRGWWTSYCK